MKPLQTQQGIIVHPKGPSKESINQRTSQEAFGNSKVEVQTKIKLWICGKTWKFMLIDSLHQVWLSLENNGGRKWGSKCATIIEARSKKVSHLIAEMHATIFLF